jgi:5-(carboxyamino)imidazole ribonucleotide mutase
MSVNKQKPLVSIIMGSQSDFKTMQNSADILKEFDIPHEIKIISAHRTPKRLYEFAENAKKNGIEIIIAGAGGAAHLPGMVAAISPLPVLGVPVKSKALKGMDSLLSIAQMPGGVPVGTFAIGDAGAKNAAIFAASILALKCEKIATSLEKFRKSQTEAVDLEPKQ